MSQIATENLSVGANQSNKIHLKGLNGMRAIAALAVVISHTNMGLYEFGLANAASLDLAGYGVTLFFALSGFLITYLLLKEKEKTGTIAIKEFYIRRILRIWPLYYFYIGLCILFFLASGRSGEVNSSILFYLFMFPNIPFIGIAGSLMGLIGHYWSLGVEEQFYSFWPVLVNKSANVFKSLIAFVIIFLCVKFFCRVLDAKFGMHLLYQTLFIVRFDCMAIGGIGACLLFYTKYNKVINLLYSKYVQMICWAIFALVAFNKFHTASILDQEIFSVVTVIIILNVSSNNKSIINLDNKIFDFLGKISFGIYVYHPLMIAALGLLIKPIVINKEAKLILIYPSIIALTLVVAYLSYTYLELYFIKKKDKYSIVHSGSSKW
ncbi:acyltransferase family protein [Hymenobacter sp. BT491]|uniref:acyltransferase family protein n=1 Tax=Hymenobacter sp. BT491 TaxID=2766779 RepID=UPI001653922E|nr:acyltransferase [Hymenobacter sp. BT491]MBC6988506.1 acyltransferase [Hymenobacter sp. BT491]